MWPQSPLALGNKHNEATTNLRENIITNKKTKDMEHKPAGNQFTIEELIFIHDALIFILGCVDSQDIPQFNKMKFVLVKVAGLIKQV